MALLPDWSAYINISNIGLTSLEVDNFIIDLDSSTTGSGTLYIDGNNGSRSNASNEEIASLISKGWSVFSSITDNRPDDDNKLEPGICGCGIADID